MVEATYRTRLKGYDVIGIETKRSNNKGKTGNLRQK